MGSGASSFSTVHMPGLKSISSGPLPKDGEQARCFAPSVDLVSSLMKWGRIQPYAQALTCNPDPWAECATHVMASHSSR